MLCAGRKGGNPITDRIFTRVGALDNLSAGQSTFMVEMEETANILNHATPDSLVIMDEIGRGTSTFDGLSIAWAVAEQLHDLADRGVKTLFATHYHELTELARQKPRVQNFNIAVKEWNDEIIFLRKLVAGSTNRSYGIQVARLAGIPDNVIKRSKKILYQIENEGHLSPNPNGASSRQKKAKGAAVQIELFQSFEKSILDRLKSLDVTRMTPLEALNVLDDICKKSRSGSN
jgi:DNA mismatch repair protein MutS